MTATLIAWTQFDAKTAKELTGWEAEGGNGGEQLAEFAGRLCYLSFNKPNPATASNAGYIANIIDHRHFSVLEHGTATFLFTGISRNSTHELIRHRHFSYSEVSQRYVDPTTLENVYHPVFRSVRGESIDLDTDVYDGDLEARSRYQRIIDKLEAVGFKGKKAREAARDVLPGGTETRIIVTGNYRAWRHFINMRGSEHADAAIRQIALDVATILKEHAPNVFRDVEFYEVDNEWCVKTGTRDDG